MERMEKMILCELIHIRFLLQSIYLDCNEAKEGTTSENVEENAMDTFRELIK